MRRLPLTAPTASPVTPDASDWDSTSTASRRTLPSRRAPSPGPSTSAVQPQSPAAATGAATGTLVTQKVAVAGARTVPPSPLARTPLSSSSVQPQTVPEQHTQLEPQSQPVLQSQPERQTQLERQSQPQLQTQPEPLIQTEIQTQPQPQTQPELQPQAQAQPHPQPRGRKILPLQLDSDEGML